MAKIEPYVHVQERVRDFPARLSIDESTNIGGVVVSPKGKLYQYISGPNEFLEKLVGAEELPRNSHISLINAYYCSYFAGLVIARALNTKATSAVRIPLTDNGSMEINMYVDGTKYDRADSTKDIVISSTTYYAWTDGVNYVYTDTLEIADGDTLYYFPFTNYEITRIATNIIQVNNETNLTRTPSDDVELNGTRYYAWVNSSLTLYTESATPLVGNMAYYIPFSDKKIDEVSSDYDFITVATKYFRSDKDDLAVNNVRYAAWKSEDNKLLYTLDPEPTIDSILFEIPIMNGTLSVSNPDWYIKMLGESFLNSEAGIDVALPSQSQTVTQWAIRMNDTLMYYGSENFLENVVAIDPIFEADFNKLIKEEVETIYDVVSIINSWSGYSAYVIGTPTNDRTAAIHIDFNTSDGMKPSDFLKIITSTDIPGSNIIKFSANSAPSSTPVSEPDKYLLIKLDEPGSIDEWKVTMTPRPTSRTGVSKLSITRDAGYSYQRFDASINKEAKDESGNNCFIENLNPGLKGIQFKVIGDFDFDSTTQYPQFETDLFGDSGVDLVMCRKASALSSAIYTLSEQKEFRIEYLSDFGITDSTFLKDYQYVGEKNYWFTPISAPYNYTTATSVSIFSNAMKDSNNVQVMGPFDKNVAFLGWPCYIAPTSKYYERVFINKSNSKEYAPVFEQTNGILNYSDPVLMLGDSDRVTLLNGTAGPAVWLVYNQALNIYYFNDNWCHTTTENVMSEEMNRRMINRIKKDAIQIMNSFKGRVNTTKTRANVEELLTIYMNNNIMSQEYKPEDFQVVCNETNNTVDIITANKLAVTLRVRLLGSIKYIDVLVDIFPLGVEFES